MGDSSEKCVLPGSQVSNLDRNVSIEQQNSLESAPTDASITAREQVLDRMSSGSLERLSSYSFDRRTSRSADRRLSYHEHESVPPARKLDGSTDWVLGHHRLNLILKLKFSPKPSLGFAGWWKTKVVDSEGKAAADERYRISFAELQNMHVRKLQCKLVKKVLDLYTSKQDVEGDGEWEQLLQQYIQGVRDFDFMTECRKRERDPFHATGEYHMDNQAFKYILSQTGLQSTLDNYQIQTENTSKEFESENDRYSYSTLLGTRHENVNALATKAFYKRLAIAGVAAAFLLGPMWMMAESRTRDTALWGTTAFVLAFGLVMARWLERDAEVMSSTAAYAAVLVVFVGLILEDASK